MQYGSGCFDICFTSVYRGTIQGTIFNYGKFSIFTYVIIRCNIMNYICVQHDSNGRPTA